jgi:hypothetical protein
VVTAAAAPQPAAPPVARAKAPRKRASKGRRAPVAASAAGPDLHLEPAAPAVAPPEESFTFPQTYGRTRVRLLMQSPGRLYVHWDLSPREVEGLKLQLGQRAAALARLALRITAPGAERALLVLLPRGARSWYVDVPAQRLEYRAELGLMLPSGEFRGVAQSNAIRTPRTTPSAVVGERRVAVGRERPPDAHALGEPVEDEPTEDERREAASAFDGGVVDAEEVPPPGGSSDLSGRRGRRAVRGRAEAVPGPGGSSDLRPPGSSELRLRR